MINTFFTIVTSSHIPHGLAALNSIRETISNKNNQYMIFVLDTDMQYSQKIVDDIKIVNIDNLYLPSYIELLDRAKYINRTPYEISNNISHKDTIRWALKPCLIDYLLNIFDTHVVYIDSDLYFINDISEVVNNTNNISLSPHNRPYGTTQIFAWMKDQNIIGDSNVFTDGFFNGGFLIVKNTDLAIKYINWWKKCCIDYCGVNKELGFYVDQKYLDFMYMHFDGIQKIHDLGCNIAEWNIYTYQITNIDLNNQEFIINNQYKPKFFHFSGSDYRNNSIMHFFYNRFISSVSYFKSLL